MSSSKSHVSSELRDGTSRRGSKLITLEEGKDEVVFESTPTDPILSSEIFRAQSKRL